MTHVFGTSNWRDKVSCFERGGYGGTKCVSVCVCMHAVDEGGIKFKVLVRHLVYMLMI